MLHKARITEYEVDGACTGYSFTKDNIKRIQRMDLELTVRVHPDNESAGRRCLDVYEQGCVVGGTIKRAVDVRIDDRLELDENLE